MILNKIIKRKKTEIQFLESFYSEKDLKTKAIGKNYDFFNLSKASTPILISEIKRASPSKGIINQNFDPITLAQSYINSGCDMISVLTDESFFWGSPSYLWEIRNNLGSKFPLLMKDFILEPIQVYLAKVLGASHYLLIVKALSEEKLSELFHLGLSIGLTPLVEVHNRKEAEVALKLEPSLLGVNHRNLEDFSINLNLTEEIIDLVPQKTILIAESGINSIETCKDLLSKGLGGFLIGEWLNKANKPGEIVKKIKSLNGF